MNVEGLRFTLEGLRFKIEGWRFKLGGLRLNVVVGGESLSCRLGWFSDSRLGFRV